ncbi:conserved hypothetical protein [Cupriavidus taiwanensis]|uniref:hypothetical protein n=1 Tax=Cupriavidus taiwanensis TaxID=164546 RepID=UPI000E12E3D0|nr:hypothetical protein [Cupriavidus taiwanensis]SOY79982.1 conserved hypothetical protein [Cupriavidus taiwanensis]SOY81950.1 conserved hypothetical protein [Cupriavidus taiwanensis]
MDDRGLLELAAKAEGRTIEWMTMYVEGREPETFSARWNPLTNDGDALRLAVKLHIPISFPFKSDDLQTRGNTVVTWSENEPHEEEEGDNCFAAARRAIVRAAAEIGRAM